MLREKPQRPHGIQFCLYKMSRIGKSIETGSRFVIILGWHSITKGCRESFKGDEIVLKLITVIAEQLLENTRLYI